MTRFWTCHWQFRFWRPDINTEGQPVTASGSNSFRKRGVSVGDSVYIISLSAGQLYIGGRMAVKQIVSRQEALTLLNRDNLYDAREWIVDPEESGTLLHLHRRLSPALTRQLRFVSGPNKKEPCFVSDTDLDNQATRGVRQISLESATLLDRIIDVSDRLPKTGQIITVTEDMLRDAKASERPSGVESEYSAIPEEVDVTAPLYEGAVRRIAVNAYERSSAAREKCILHYGCRCAACGLTLAEKYGESAQGLIHVHHVRQLSDVNAKYQVDPVQDLRPVCPTCHAIIHTRTPPFTVEEVTAMIDETKNNANQAVVGTSLRAAPHR